MRVSQVLAANIKQWGIGHVFGIPGKSISPLMLDLDSEGIEFVLTRHESGAGFAAAGYALMNRNIGIAMGTSGPGGTNLLTAAGQAKAYNLPVLILTGQPSIAESGKALGQDSSPFATDLARMFEPVTLFSARVERADQMERYLQHALEKAVCGAKGPVHLCIPFDILMSPAEPFSLTIPTHIPKLVSPNLDEAAQIIRTAQNPVIIAGKGVVAAGAYEELRVLAERCRIPVILTPGGKGVFRTKHPLCLGNFGLGGTQEAAEHLKSGIDVMIAIGTKLSDMSLSGVTPEMMPKQVVHLDYDITFMGKGLPVPTCVVWGDAKDNLKGINERLETAADSGSSLYEAAVASTLARAAVQPVEPGAPLSAVDAVRALRSALPAEAILFGDDGSHTFYAIKDFEILEPGTFIFDDVFGAMGHAIGYAVGAKAAAPDRTIVCLTGDGCTMMHGTEISTAVNHGLAVLFVVFNNGRLDMVDKGNSYNTGRSVGTVYQSPLDAAGFARSMGAQAFRCSTAADIQPAVLAALAAEGPTVIEVMVDPLEIPPTLSRVLKMD